MVTPMDCYTLILWPVLLPSTRAPQFSSHCSVLFCSSDFCKYLPSLLFPLFCPSHYSPIFSFCFLFWGIFWVLAIVMKHCLLLPTWLGRILWVFSSLVFSQWKLLHSQASVQSSHKAVCVLQLAEFMSTLLVVVHKFIKLEAFSDFSWKSR